MWLQVTLSTSEQTSRAEVVGTLHNEPTKPNSSEAQTAEEEKAPLRLEPKASELRQADSTPEPPREQTGTKTCWNAVHRPNQLAHTIGLCASLFLHNADPVFVWMETCEYYMYPLLLACYTRHGSAAEAALQGISQCLDAGVFDATDDGLKSCRLELVVEAVTSICHQAVKSRFALALPFFRKVL